MCLILIKGHGEPFKIILRCCLTIGLALCLACWGHVPGALASPDAAIAIYSGFDGVCKQGGLNPVLVEVEAGDSGFSGDLKVKAGDGIYTSRVELAGGVKKTVRFSIPFFGGDEKLEAVLENEAEVRAEAVYTPEIVAGNTLLIGVLGNPPAGLHELEAMDTSQLGAGRARLAVLGGEIPYTLEELENLNFILIDDFNTADLGGPGAELLEAWVGRGNCLLAGAGTHSHKNLTGLLAGLKEPSWRGDGVIVPVPGDFSVQTPAFVRDMLVEHLPPHALAKAVKGGNLQDRSAGAVDLAGAADSLLRPQKHTLSLLGSLLLYVAALLAAAFYGEKNKWWYGVSVVFFSLLFLGLSLQGGLFRAVAGGVAVRVHGGVTQTHALTCVYPGGQGEVRIKIPGAAFAWAAGDRRTADAMSGEVVCSGETGHYVYTSSLSGDGGEGLGLAVDGNGIITGKIGNPLADGLTNSFMIIGDTVIPVGDLAGRETITVNYRPDHALGGTGDYNYLELLYRAAGVRDGERQLLDYYHHHLDDYKAGGRLIGFSQETAETEINGRGLKTSRLVMNVFPIDIEGEPGRLNLPGEVIRPVTDCPRGAGKREHVCSPGEEFNVYYAMPPGVEPREISLTGMPGGGDGGLWAYNRADKTWEEVRDAVLAGEKLESYISSGPLALKVRGSGKAMVPQAAVKGVAQR